MGLWESEHPCEGITMRTTRIAWTTLGAASLFVVSASLAPAAPAPGQAAKSADKWEYAELHSGSRIFRGGEEEQPGRGGRGGRGGFQGGGGGAGGGQGGGGGAGGGTAPAQPVPAAQPALPRLTIRWVTGDGEMVASSWE